ncbi:WXG100 family type VII secretion target [Arachnia propionica]|uniref:WXG100 family type VII secretion target n=2 Tax=Arachnia propionica TaxID=1750 RepID=A0A3P1WQM1_9ACTN|nr:WXG100 family type VII secretion target [Arachnia propionica]
MADQMRVVDQALITGAQKAEEVAASVRTKIDTVVSHKGDSTAGWGGPAALAMQSTVDQWAEAARPIATALEELAAKLRGVDAENVRTEEEQTAVYNSIKGRMG